MAQQLSPDNRRDIYSISRLNQEIKLLLESSFPLLWVEGELSNLARPRSGHMYFSLKDANAQVRCAMFRNRNSNLRFQPKDGDQVLVRAKLSLYAPRGDFQLIVEHMEEAGDGALRRAFEVLKAKLQNEGLFDEAHKRDLPTAPRRIGVITSPTGAAIRDTLTVLRRRFPALEVLIYPVAVQGDNAAPEIAEMIRLAGRRNEVDALLLTRGGGSLEDLWAFNEEVVARAIHDCELPIVSAVGHEIDFTIADFVADRRAPTPSAGAEMLSPDGPAWLQRVNQLATRLTGAMNTRVNRDTERFNALARRLDTQHPGRRLQERWQRLDELEQRLTHATRSRLRHLEIQRKHLADRLAQQDPRQRIRQLGDRRDSLERRLTSAMREQLSDRRYRFQSLARALEAVSPLATLSRGYSITQRETDGTLLRDASDIQPNELVISRLHQGELVCRVESVRKPGDETLLGKEPEGED